MMLSKELITGDGSSQAKRHSRALGSHGVCPLVLRGLSPSMLQTK